MMITSNDIINNLFLWELHICLEDNLIYFFDFHSLLFEIPFDFTLSMFVRRGSLCRLFTSLAETLFLPADIALANTDCVVEN